MDRIDEGSAFQIDGIMYDKEHYLNLREDSSGDIYWKLNVYRGWFSELRVSQIYIKERRNIYIYIYLCVIEMSRIRERFL